MHAYDNNTGPSCLTRNAKGFLWRVCLLELLGRQGPESERTPGLDAKNGGRGT